MQRQRLTSIILCILPTISCMSEFLKPALCSYSSACEPYAFSDGEIDRKTCLTSSHRHEQENYTHQNNISKMQIFVKTLTVSATLRFIALTEWFD